jgi:hypothetical protein
MGYRLAKACTLTHAPISANARVVLNIMAWNAMDNDTKARPAATYFGGWDLLGLWMGDAKSDDARERMIARAIAELTACGLIKATTTTGRRKRQAYQITVDY